MNSIYLDHAATTPIHPQVIEAMKTAMETIGNPSSIHSYGREARKTLDESRETLATLINAQFSEIVFTSGGTEANNFAIIGIAKANKNRGKHIITTSFEHHAVLNPCEYLEKEGFEVTYLAPDENGIVSVTKVKEALRDDTILVSIMYANNEVGTIQPIQEIGELLADHPAYFHTDAVQAFGTQKIDVKKLGVDLLTITAHKINGPKGIGCLYIKDGTRIQPILFGGEQERKRRAGTENLPGVVGFKEAALIANDSLEENNQKYKELKTIFTQKLQEKIDVLINGSFEQAVPHIVNISFPKTDVESMLVNLDMKNIAASSGSACTAGSLEPSHVLVAMFGSDSERVQNSIRFSFGLGNTKEQVILAAEAIIEIVQRFQQ